MTAHSLPHSQSSKLYLSAAATALVLCVLVPGATAISGISDWTPGFATFYGGAPDGLSPYSPSYGTSVGSCGFGVLDKGQWPYWTVGALSTKNQFFLSGPVQGCGMCFEVECLESGPLGNKQGSCQPDPAHRSIVIQITDQCPECESNHLDLQALSWAKIAKPSPAGGRINLQYRRVQCAPPSNIVVSVTANRGGNGWIQLDITKAGGRAAVKLVEARGPGGEWRAMNNVFGASWELANAPRPPLDLRITDDQGNTVTASDVVQAADVTGMLPTTAQFQIQDPSDVQPSGTTVGASAIFTSNATRTSGGAPEVQAFNGPPESSSTAGAPQISPSLSPSGSNSPTSPHSLSQSRSGSPSLFNSASPSVSASTSPSPSLSHSSSLSPSHSLSPSPPLFPSPSSTPTSGN